MGWLFDALELESDKTNRERVDAAIRAELSLPGEVHCPEVWAAVKDLDEDARVALVAAVHRALS